jgi:hypothetical protein
VDECTAHQTGEIGAITRKSEQKTCRNLAGTMRYYVANHLQTRWIMVPNAVDKLGRERYLPIMMRVAP